MGLISTSLLLICALIHFRSHFAFSFGKKLIIPRQKELAFYPSLWTIYLLYLTLLSASIIILQIFNIQHRILIWIVCYGVILSSCWESLFSFHRYCTLKNFQTRSSKIKTTKILQKFIAFAFVYISLFITQLHIIYWLFPAINIIYISFNIFCQYRFTQMLLKQYSTLSGSCSYPYSYSYSYKTFVINM